MAQRMTKAEREAKNARMDEQWAKERDRIMRAGRRLKNRGYALDADFIPAKKMTRHDDRILNKVRKFREDELYTKVSFSAKGKTVHGKRARKYEQEIKEQNKKTPDVDPFENLKADLEKMIASLKDTVSGYDWNSQQLYFISRGQNVDLLGKVEELQGAIDSKLTVLDSSQTSLEYYNYLQDNMSEINACLQDAYTESNGEKAIAALDRAIAVILQESPRAFDSGDFTDYGLEEVDEELPY